MPKFQFEGGCILGKLKLKRGDSGQVKTENTQSAKICLNFNFQWGGGYSGQVKTENTQSAKICLNFNFHGEGGGILGKSKLKILKVTRYA